MRALNLVITSFILCSSALSHAEPVGPIEIIGTVVKFDEKHVTIKVDGKTLVVPRAAAAGDIVSGKRAVFKLTTEEYLVTREN